MLQAFRYGVRDYGVGVLMAALLVTVSTYTLMRLSGWSSIPFVSAPAVIIELVPRHHAH